jgi:hypothetical protein
MSIYSIYQVRDGHIEVSNDEINIGDTIVYGNITLKEGWNWGFHAVTGEDVDHFREMSRLMNNFSEALRNKVFTKKVVKATSNLGLPVPVLESTTI